MEFRNNIVLTTHRNSSVNYSSYLNFISFDSNNPKEVARQTVYNLVPYPITKWSNLSKESKSFVMCKFVA